MVLGLLLGPANRPDQELFEAVLDDIPPVATPAGGRRRRPDKCQADKGYDARQCRGYLARRGIKIRIARKGGDRVDGRLPVGGPARADADHLAGNDSFIWPRMMAWPGRTLATVSEEPSMAHRANLDPEPSIRRARKTGAPD